MREACNKFGKQGDGSTEWKERMERAGFVDVHQETRKVCFVTPYYIERASRSFLLTAEVTHWIMAQRPKNERDWQVSGCSRRERH